VELPRIEGERLTLRPVAEADLDPLADIVLAPGVREWWGAPRERDKLKKELRLPEETDGAWAIEVGGELAGWLGCNEERHESYRMASFDIFLAPPFQNRGLGPDALRMAIRHFAERGHHLFLIDPNARNERAIAAYKSVGFKEVGVIRRYELGADGRWHDSLLLDLVIEELRE
jgi:aminoglycoside 6'-N-acetyltransferase